MHVRRELSASIDRPGGRLILNVPGPAAPLFETPADAMGKHVSPQAAGFVHAVFSIDDEAELEGLLDGAGFRDISVFAEMRELSLPGAREFLWQYVRSTPLAGVVAGADQQARSALEDEVVTEWSRFEEVDGMPYRQRILTAFARR